MGRPPEFDSLLVWPTHPSLEHPQRATLFQVLTDEPEHFLKHRLCRPGSSAHGTLELFGAGLVGEEGAENTFDLKGLLDDRCPSPHWGIVLEGSIQIRHKDGSEETVGAGDVYHWPAGHTGSTEEVSPSSRSGPVGPMRQFSEHAKKLFS